MARTAIGAAVVLCLGFTGPSVARADQSHDLWIDDPYQAHDTTGALVRVGSLVGVLGIDDREYTGLGATVAAGQRWGRFTLEGEYGYLEITERGPSSQRYGAAHQLGASARFDVIRLGPRVVGPNSMVGVYVEAHLGRQFRDPDLIAPDESRRALLPGGSTNQLGAGFGFVFDHRLEQPRGFPNRVGWQLGWRVVGAPRPAPDTFATCRGSECTAAPGPKHTMDVGVNETSLLLGSTLDFTW